MSWLGRLALVEAVAIAGVSAWLLLRPRADLTLSAQPVAGAGAQAAPASGAARRDLPAREHLAGSALAPAAGTSPVAQADGVLLFGRVTDPGGKPLGGGWLQARPPDGASPARSCEIAAGGDYAFAGLAAGAWELSGKVGGFRPLTHTVTLPRTPAEQRLDLALEPAVTLKVWFVTPEGKRLSADLRAAGLDWRVELAAFASDAPPEGPLMPSRDRQLWGRGLGSWSGAEFTRRGQDAAPEVPDGTYELDGAPPVFLSAALRHCVLATQRVAPGQTEVRFALGLDRVRAQLATLKLRLTDAQTGAPLSEVRIETHDLQGGGGAGKTSADGVFEKPGLAPGLLSLRAMAKDHEELRFWFRLRPGQVTDLGTFALGKDLRLKGTVVGPDDQPLAARISWLDVDRAPFPQGVEWNYTTHADGDGRFEISRAGRTRYLVVAAAKGLAAAAVLADLRSGEVPPLRLELQRGTRVTLDKHLGMADEFEALVKDSEGRMPWSGELVQRHPTTFLLAPGSYTLELHDEQGLRRAVPFTVGSEPVTVRVER